MTSYFLGFHGFRREKEREREGGGRRERGGGGWGVLVGERELIPYKEVCSFLIFHIPAVAP